MCKRSVLKLCAFFRRCGFIQPRPERSCKVRNSAMQNGGANRKPECGHHGMVLGGSNRRICCSTHHKGARNLGWFSGGRSFSGVRHMVWSKSSYSAGDAPLHVARIMAALRDRVSEGRVSAARNVYEGRETADRIMGGGARTPRGTDRAATPNPPSGPASSHQGAAWRGAALRDQRPPAS